MKEMRPIVYLVGIGMGSEAQLTGRAMDCLEAAQVIMGADRMLDSIRDFGENKQVFVSYKPSEFNGWEAFAGRKRRWCFLEIPAFTVERRQPEGHF